MKLKSRWKRAKNRRWMITDKMFFSLFLTGIIVEFSQVGAGFVDGLVVGRCLGSVNLAAQGISIPVYSVMGIFSGLLAVSMQVRCSQEIGHGNRREVSRFFSVTVYVGIAFSVLLTAALLLFARPFAVLLGASGKARNLLEPATDYLIGFGIGVPPQIMTAILAPAIQLDSGRKKVQTGAMIGTIANIAFDLLAVKWNMGLFGIGLGTSIAGYLNLFYQCTHFFQKDRILCFVKPDVPVAEYLKMLWNGSENAVKRLANTIRPIILNAIIIAYGGTVAMSALSVRNNFANFTEIFGAGIASAVSLLSGFHFGEINREAIEEVRECEHRMILIFSGAICALLLLAAKPIARLYVQEDGEIIDMVCFAIRMLALQNPLQALIASRIKYLQAIQRNLNMNLLIFSAKLVFVLLSAFVLGNLFGVYGILACYTVSDAISLIAVLLFYMFTKRRMRLTKGDILNLPDEFQLQSGDLISLDIRNEEDISLCTEQITLFCKGHRIDPKVARYAALSFEELATNIIEYGFPKNHASHPMIDLRAVATEDTFVLRIRDNCPQYNVTAHFAAVNEENADRTKNIGTRIVSRMATDISYLHAFETNNIIIRFPRHFPEEAADS